MSPAAHPATPLPAGTPCWADLLSTDLEGARAFTAALLGWDFRIGDESTGFYSMATVRGHDVAGLGTREDDSNQSVWTTYLASADCDATCEAVVAAGGAVVSPPADVLDFGRKAIVQDPTQSRFGIWQGGSMTGFGLRDEPGTVLWNELMTRDYEGSKAFYAAVFGYSYTEIVSGESQYSTIDVGGRPVGGLGTIPPDVPAHIPPHWRVFFAVPDADEAAERAVGLGAMVRRRAADAPYGRHVGLAHPHCGGFAVIAPPPLSGS